MKPSFPKDKGASQQTALLLLLLNSKGLIRLLSSPSPCVLSSHTEDNYPRHRSKQHRRRRRPSQRQELTPLIRIQADIVAILVNQIRRLDNNSRHNSARYRESQEGHNRQEEVATRCEPAGREERDEREDDAQACCGGTDAVQDKHCGHGDVEGFDAILDVVGVAKVS